MSYVDRAYFDLLQQVLEHGEDRTNRTDICTRSLFGTYIEVPLDPFPILQLKRTFFRGVVEELVWFLNGSTNVSSLQEKGIHIWDGNATPEFMKSRGLGEYPPNELGPIYGWQWRHWGGLYPDKEGGVDQIQNIIQQIKEDPYSRRILLSAWNVGDLDKMALPPCHVLAQFYVHRQGKLDCHVYQRSCDIGLGLPFNIASYALLTHMLSYTCGLQVGKLRISIGDAHIYHTHIEKLRTLQKPETHPEQTFPRLRFMCKPKQDPREYRYEDLVLDDYEAGTHVSLPLAI